MEPAAAPTSRLFQSTAVSRQRAEENKRPAAASSAKLPSAASSAARSSKVATAVFTAAAGTAPPAGPPAAPLAGTKRRFGSDSAAAPEGDDTGAGPADAAAPRAVAAPPPPPAAAAAAKDPEQGEAAAAVPGGADASAGPKFELSSLEFGAYRSFLGAAKRSESVGRLRSAPQDGLRDSVPPMCPSDYGRDLGQTACVRGVQGQAPLHEAGAAALPRWVWRDRVCVVSGGGQASRPTNPPRDCAENAINSGAGGRNSERWRGRAERGPTWHLPSPPLLHSHRDRQAARDGGGHDAAVDRERQPHRAGLRRQRREACGEGPRPHGSRGCCRRPQSPPRSEHAGDRGGAGGGCEGAGARRSRHRCRAERHGGAARAPRGSGIAAAGAARRARSSAGRGSGTARGRSSAVRGAAAQGAFACVCTPPESLPSRNPNPAARSLRHQRTRSSCCTSRS